MDPRVGVPLSVKFDLDVHEHDSDVTIGSIGICPSGRLVTRGGYECLPSKLFGGRVPIGARAQ